MACLQVLAGAREKPRVFYVTSHPLLEASFVQIPQRLIAVVNIAVTRIRKKPNRTINFGNNNVGSYLF
jgi:hypothetical protein